MNNKVDSFLFLVIATLIATIATSYINNTYLEAPVQNVNKVVRGAK